MTINGRIEAGRRERRVLTRVSRRPGGWSMPDGNGHGRWPRPAPGDLDPYLRPGDDWPGTANVATGLARVAAVLDRIASDAGELARARQAGELTIAAVLPSRRVERRRRLAEPDPDFRTFCRTKQMPGSTPAQMERAWDAWQAERYRFRARSIPGYTDPPRGRRTRYGPT